MRIEDAIFVVCATVAVVCGLLVVTRRSPVYAVVYMLPLFGAMAVLFVMLSAPFIAAIQILVYGGAIIVVFLFVIMLINLGPEDQLDEGPKRRWLGAGFAGVALLVLLCYPIGRALSGSRFPALDPAKLPANFPEQFGTTSGIGVALFQSYVVPFELTSVLIVVGILGAILLSKEKI